MIYLKKVSRKMNKYIEDKNERKYKKTRNYRFKKTLFQVAFSKTLEATENLLKKLVY